MYTREQIESAIESKGYKWFSKGTYNLNIVGVRNSETKNKVTNRFDDKLTISYMKESSWNPVELKWKFFCFDCTTDPGTHWVKNILNKNGVAILKPGQYRGSHKIRLHAGKYEALGQKAPLKVYRDGNLDETYDMNEDNVKEGIYGINIHRATRHAGRKSTQIDKWSAGCQVIAANDDFQTFMKICRKSRTIWGNSFTYTLIESKDIS